jgi:SAM-dependent methyltransferase
MELAAFRHLQTPAGQEALAAARARAPREVDFLSDFTQLARRFPPEIARAALEVAILQAEARRKFPDGGPTYFTREALEQASSRAVAAYRAERYRGLGRVADLGCSVGGDLLELARVAPAFGLDRDSLRLALAAANLTAAGLTGDLLRADLNAPLPFAPSAELGLFFDPARRVDGRRLHSVERYQPPLSRVREWLPRFPALGVKLSPGVDLAELADYPAEVEFISLRGELKEAVLWFGPLRRGTRRATLLPGPHSLTPDDHLPPLPLAEPGAYLWEPDAAVLRAGLVKELGHQLGAAQLDADIAYLSGDQLQETPFAQAYPITAWFPFQLKRLRAALRERSIGQVVVKKRGSPLQPEALMRELRLSGPNQATVFLTHLRGRPIVLLSPRLPGAAD